MIRVSSESFIDWLTNFSSLQPSHENLPIVLNAIERELAVFFIEIELTVHPLLDVHEHLLGHLDLEQFGAHGFQLIDGHFEQKLFGQSFSHRRLNFRDELDTGRRCRDVMLFID